MKKLNKNLNNNKLSRWSNRAYGCALALALVGSAMMPAFAAAPASDPLTTIGNFSAFVFAALKAIGGIVVAFSLVQFGLALKGHDASQRDSALLGVAGGVIIYFAKEILDMIA